MNLKQYISSNYLNKKCEVSWNQGGCGITFGVNPSKETCMIKEVGDDFAIIEDDYKGRLRLTIVPVSGLSIVDLSKQ